MNNLDTNSPASPVPRAMYRENDVMQLISVSRSTLWRWCRVGLFPKPIRLGPNSIRWKRAEVDTWLDARPPFDQQ